MSSENGAGVPVCGITGPARDRALPGPVPDRSSASSAGPGARRGGRSRNARSPPVLAQVGLDGFVFRNLHDGAAEIARDDLVAEPRHPGQ